MSCSRLFAMVVPLFNCGMAVLDVHDESMLFIQQKQTSTIETDVYNMLTADSTKDDGSLLFMQQKQRSIIETDEHAVLFANSTTDGRCVWEEYEPDEWCTSPAYRSDHFLQVPQSSPGPIDTCKDFCDQEDIRRYFAPELPGLRIKFGNGGHPHTCFCINCLRYANDKSESSCCSTERYFTCFIPTPSPTPRPATPRPTTPSPTVDSCASATDLATLTSPHSDSTVNAGNTIGSCGSGNERIFYYNLPAGESIHIAQTSNSFDSKHETRWGGSCPGSNSVQCSDDPDEIRHTWTNDQTSTQRVFFIVDAFSSSGSGIFTIDWELVSATPPAATDWYLGQFSASCDEVCSQMNRACSELGYPTSLGAFKAILMGSSANRDANCSQFSSRRLPYNPGMASDGLCRWDNNAASDSCGQSSPGYRRFCPCVTAPSVSPTPAPTPTPTAPSVSPTPAPTLTPTAPVLADAGPLQLETNSLGGDGGLLRFSNVFLDGTELVVENTTEYTPFKANVTGLAAPLSSLAQISLGCGETVEMNFEFILDSQPVIPSAFNFTVADLDKGTQDRCLESVEMSDWNAYFLYPDQVSSSINMTETAGRLRFTGLTRGSVEDNPVNMFNMTTEQKMKAVTFLVEGKNGFTMKFATIDPEESSTDPDVVGYNGRRILFGLGNP